MEGNCRACDSVQLHLLYDAGLQPSSHPLLTGKEELAPVLPMRLGICGGCETVQWGQGWPVAYFQSDNTVYREPEHHLDEVARQILKFSLPERFRIGMHSSKDESLARRLVECGGIIATEPPYDLYLSRHRAEHAQSLSPLFSQWRSFLSDRGYLYVEVPDTREPLTLGDVTVLWEQHLLYFSRFTLQGALARAGFHASFLDLPTINSRSENLLALIADASKPPNYPASQKDRDIAQAFPFRLAQRKKAWERFLNGTKTAALGAGHDLITFLNYQNLGRHLEFVVDDSPAKLGHFLPGSRLPILPVSAIRKSRVDICLLGVMSEAEPKVLDRLGDFIRDGGQVFSIYPMSRLAPREICQAANGPLFSPDHHPEKF